MLLCSLELMMGSDEIPQGANRRSYSQGKAIFRPRGAFARDWQTVFLWIAWVSIVLVTCLLVALRLSLPTAGQFRPEVEQWIDTITGQNVSIGSLDVAWHGWTPELAVKDIRLPNTPEDAPAIQSLKIRIGLDPLSFWKVSGIHAKKLSLSGMSLTIVRKLNGALHLTGIGTFPSSTKPQASRLLSWLLRQPHVDVESANIRWHDEGNPEAFFFMPNARLGIRKDGPRHKILVTMRPRETHPSKSLPPLDTTSGLLSGMANITVNPATLDWSGSMFLRVEDFDFDRFPSLQKLIPSMVSGVTNLEFWTFWDKGRLEHVEGKFAFQDLGLGNINRDGTDQEKYIDSQTEQPKEHSSTLPCEVADSKILFHRMHGYLKLNRIGIDNWQLQLHQFTLATPGEEWPSTHARAQIAWSRNHHGWLLKAQDVELENEDITVRLVGTGRWSEDHSSPDLRLVMAIERGKLDKLGQYLPTSLMESSLVEWLDHAFPKGELTQGKLLFHGRIADFPFDNGKGVFQASAKTSDKTILNYEQSWPPIEELEAGIAFDGRSLSVITHGGSVYGVGIERITAEIPDILAETPILTIHGQTTGALAKGLSFLRESPLADPHASRIAGIKATGKHRLDLEIRIPLQPRDPNRAQGKITFLDNTLEIDIPWTVTPETTPPLILEQVNGVIRFDEHGIAGKSITARYLDRPVTLDVVKATDTENTTRFIIDGLDTDTLLAYPTLKSAAQKMSPSLSSFITSTIDKAAWRVILDLPNDWGQNNQQARLRVVSDLHDAVDLPPPLTGRPFQAEMLFGDTQPQALQDSERGIRFAFGSKLTGIFSPGKSDPWRGAIRLGRPGTIHLPKKGIRIDGHIPYLSLDRWHPLLTGLAKSESISETQHKPTVKASPFKKIPIFQAEISADELVAFDQTFRNTTSTVVRGNDGIWHIRMQTDTVQGHIRIPRSGTNETTAIALTRLQLPSIDDSEPFDFDPGDIPPIRLTCENLTYGKRPLGQIELLEVSPNSQGLDIKTIKIKSENFRIQGHGMWEHHARSNQSRTRFQLKINSPDLGKLLSSFGYEGKVADGGETDLELDIQWPAPPNRFQLGQASGAIKVKVTDGRLLAIEPGATGRMFGLLSIALLPRRLLLDFRDFFQEGLVYDEMKGGFRFRGGHAETDDFSVEGPTARVDIVGNTGLINKDYNQTATVTPKLSSSIPLAAIGIIQKLLDSPFFDKAFSYQYAIRGTWDDPKIEPVESPEQEEDRTDDDV
uniref:TIGR02099 family protein n=1 Tax=Candidatus Kentrum sp. FW TaxID=2126338 RepID=A0A450S4V2_9GAMM|nr:MAG: TIGR02099 family protein [Candidatus Kentron sp. FW]